MLRTSSNFVAALVFNACNAQYMITTNLHDHLRKGMTKQQFMEAWQRKNKDLIAGSAPTASRNFTTRNDNWEILIYSVYEYASVRAGRAIVDHKEYVAFRNGFLEEWGAGTLQLSLENDPAVIHLESAK